MALRKCIWRETLNLALFIAGLHCYKLNPGVEGHHGLITIIKFDNFVFINIHDKSTKYLWTITQENAYGIDSRAIWVYRQLCEIVTPDTYML